MPIAMKRAYEKPGARDGLRILVDGLWPRGMTKEKLRIADWMREIAPSAELRKWYGHKPEKWQQFRDKFRRELRIGRRKELLEELVRLAEIQTVTLVFGTRDASKSNAAVIWELALDRLLRRAGR